VTTTQAPLPPLIRALIRWQHAAGPYWPYVCAAPFLGNEGSACHPERSAESVLGPKERGILRCAQDDSYGEADKVGHDQKPASARHPAPGSRGTPARLARLADRLALDGRLALFVDLPPERTLAAAPGLVEAGFLVVPVVQRWVAARAVIPCRRLVELLIGVGERLRRPTRPRGVVLLLDEARHGPRADRAPRAPRGFDNRYSLRADRFPPAEFLRHDRIERVSWLAPNGIAPDLLRYVQLLESGGYLVESLPGLVRPPRR
jgi:hypothetical protein